MAAEKENRKKIAIELLQNEDSIKDQVPILLTMGQYEAALKIAVNHCEADIAYGIISEMRKPSPPEKPAKPEVVRTCLAVEGAMPYLISYAQQRKLVDPNDSTFSEILDHARRLDPRNPQNADSCKKMQTLGVMEIDEYDFVADVLHLRKLKEQYQRFNTIASKLPKGHYQRTRPILTLYIELIGQKNTLFNQAKKKTMDLGQSFYRSEGLFQTLIHLYEKQPTWEYAETIVKPQQVDKRHQALMRLRAAARIGDWGLFMELIKKEKLKFPPQYYAQTCLEFNNKELAIGYIRQIPKVDERVTLLMDLEYSLLILA
jgi:hypothetical protein